MESDRTCLVVLKHLLDFTRLELWARGSRVAIREQDEHVQGSKRRAVCRSGDNMDIVGCVGW